MLQDVGVGDDGSRSLGVWLAGDAAKGEFHCTECGYGVTVFKALPTCPMCGGEGWEQSSWSPFNRELERS